MATEAKGRGESDAFMKGKEGMYAQLVSSLFLLFFFVFILEE